MNSQMTSQDDVARGNSGARAAAGSGPADGQGAPEAGVNGDHHAIAQAVRAVMQPELHEPEWRYFHGAMPG
jgi:hypothetical protein